MTPSDSLGPPPATSPLTLTRSDALPASSTMATGIAPRPAMSESLPSRAQALHRLAPSPA